MGEKITNVSLLRISFLVFGTESRKNESPRTINNCVRLIIFLSILLGVVSNKIRKFLFQW